MYFFSQDTPAYFRRPKHYSWFYKPEKFDKLNYAIRSIKVASGRRVVCAVKDLNEFKTKQTTLLFWDGGNNTFQPSKKRGLISVSEHMWLSKTMVTKTNIKRIKKHEENY